MFGFGKTEEDVGEKLFLAAMEYSRRLKEDNFFKFSPQTPPAVRFSVGAFVFGSLMCQNIASTVLNEQGSSRRALEMCKRMTERHLKTVSTAETVPVRVADIVVWWDELFQVLESPINPIINHADPATATLTYVELLRELYRVRGTRMDIDMLKGVAAVLERGRTVQSVHHLLMPVSCSFILQITGEESMATEEMVTALALYLIPNWSVLDRIVRDILKQ